MSKLDAVDILISARSKIADPACWGKGRRNHDRPLRTCCASEALYESNGDLGPQHTRAVRAFRNAAGIDFGTDIPKWNDAPERTHAEVLAAFNLAIATLRLR